MRDAFPRAATAIVSTATYGIGEAPGHSASPQGLTGAVIRG